MADVMELLDRIRREQDNFPAAQKKVAAFVVENYQQIAFLPISALSQRVGVSDNTVIKFCNHLGYEKFTEFKKEFTSYAHSELLIYNKIGGESAGPVNGDSVWGMILNDNIAALRETLNDPQNQGSLTELLARMEKAKHIYVTGGRLSGIAAAMLANKLRYLNLQVHDLSCGTVGDYIDQTALVQPEDLVIAISFPRYTKRVVTALEDMHRRGVPIALITDKGLSPVHPFADVVFHCTTDSSAFLPCYAGCLALIDVICQAVCVAHRAEITEYVRELEKRLLAQGVWM